MDWLVLLSWVRKTCYLLLGGCFCGVYGQPASAQPPPFEVQFPLDQPGVYLGSLREITQTQDGYLWIASANGVYRYDGIRLHPYTLAPAGVPATGLLSNSTMCIEEGIGDELWIGTTRGLSLLDRSRERFYHFEADPESPFGLDNPFVSALLLDSRQQLWVGSWDGLHRYDRTHQRLEKVHLAGLPAKDLDIRTIIESRQGDLWIGARDHLLRFRPGEGVMKVYRPQQSGNARKNFREIESIAEDEAGNLFFCGWNYRLQWLPAGSDSLQSLSDSLAQHPSLRENYQVQDILIDKSGVHWLGTTRGLFRWMPGKEALNLVSGVGDSSEEAPPKPATEIGIECLYEDAQGNFWFGLQERGLARLQRQSQRFGFQPVYDPLSGEAIRANVFEFLSDPAGRRWAVTGNGFLLCHLPQAPAFSLPFRRLLQTLEGQHLLSVAPGLDDEFWIGTRNDGLWRCSWERGLLEVFSNEAPPPNQLPHEHITALLHDSRDRLWVATDYGIIRLDLHTLQATDLPIAGQEVYLHYIPVTHMLEDKNGSVWVGSRKGLHRWQPGEARFSLVQTGPKGTNALPEILGLTYDHKRHGLWLGQMDGLFFYDLAQERLVDWGKRFPSLNIPLTNVVLSDNLLWLTGWRMMLAVDLDHQRVRVFHQYEGIPEPHFNLNSAWTSEAGVCYLGGATGTTAFRLEGLPPRETAVPVYLDKLYLNHRAIPVGGSLLPKALRYLDTLVLSHEQSHFNLSFSAPDLRYPDYLQHAYLLEGWNKGWQHIGPERVARFSQVTPGTYRLRVKVANRDMEWRELEQPLTLIVTPPWWATGWAYLAYGLLALGLLLGLRMIIVYRENLRQQLRMEKFERQQVRKLHAELKAVDEMKTRFFDDICHELRTPLSLILGPLQNLRDQLPERAPAEVARLLDPPLKNIEHNTQRLKRLVDQLLDLARTQNGLVQARLRVQDLRPPLSLLEGNFVFLAEKQGVALHLLLPAHPLWVAYDEDLLEKMLNNLLSNALRHTSEGGSIRLRLSQVGEEACIEVADTGEGMTPEQLRHIFERFYRAEPNESRQGLGIGLALTRELVQLHGGRIAVESEPGKGSTFQIWLRLRQEEKPEAAPSAAPAAAGKKSRVLLIEDHEPMRHFLQDQLSQHYEVATATDGVAGFALSQRWQPDLVISDVMMPREDGLSLCRRLKATPETAHIPVLLLTARDSEGHRMAGLAAGADVYLSKPFQTRHLLQEAETLLANRARVREALQPQVILAPGALEVEDEEQLFLQAFMTEVEKHLGDPDFEVQDLARQLGVSRSVLYERIKQLTGQSVAALIRETRLLRACQYLEETTYPIAEVSDRVGFRDPGYFRKAFAKKFGLSPSQYAAQRSNG